jgi:hypothetical protein
MNLSFLCCSAAALLLPCYCPAAALLQPPPGRELLNTKPSSTVNQPRQKTQANTATKTAAKPQEKKNQGRLLLGECY